ncbi:MAG: hypothetical protein JWN40_3412 [Phycisphaerales bacterium]|nr:hypothetical protein [Phycisphaerales bacterium]
MTTDRFRKRLLGISLGERGALVAEVACAGEVRRAVRVGEFAYPAGLTLEQPEALGVALGEFLTKSGFSTRRAVLGVPARWLLLKSYALPPVEPHAAASMLWLRAEAESAPELGEMVLDFAGQTSVLDPTTVLLMGLPRRSIDRLRTFAAGAGLNVTAITPCSTALGGATAKQTGSAHILSLNCEGAELSEHEGEQTRFLRHLGSAGTSLAPLVAELRRAAVTHPLNAATLTNDVSAIRARRSPQALVLWDDVGLDNAAMDSIAQALNVPVVRGELQSIGCAGEALTGGRVGAVAAALTFAPLAGGRPAVDFLHPRLSAPKKPNVTRRTAWLTGAAAVVALVALLAYTDLARMQRRVTGADEELKRLEPTLKTARPFVANMEFVETFQASRPKYLACLSDLTLAIPEDGQTYVTRFHLQSSMRGECVGRSPNNQEVLNLMDKLSAGGRFKDLKRKLEARGAGPEVAFTVTFTYVPK